MKNILVLTMGLFCAGFSTNAQLYSFPILDSAHNSPFLYGYYNWDDVLENLEDCYLPASHEFPRTSRISRIPSYAEFSSFITSVSGIAFYQHSDSVLHAIGIAVAPIMPFHHEQFFLGLYDSNMELQRGMEPVHYDPWDADAPPNLYCQVYDLYPKDADEFTSPFMLSFFDEPIDLSGDYYLSFREEHYLWPFMVWEENHDPPFHVGGLNIKWYQTNSKTWVDDTLLQNIPQIFLIVEPECHTLDSMRVTIDSMGNVTVEWDSIPWQQQWVLRLQGYSETRYDTVETYRHTYYNLDTNSYYALSILSQCFLPGGRHNLSSWSDPVGIGHGVAAIRDVPDFMFQVSIRPNPASRQVEVTSSLPMTRIEASNVQGHCLYDRPAAGLSATLDIDSWPAGTYFLRISTPSGTATRKLLVK